MPQKKQNESSEVKHDKERVLFTWLGYADCYAAITSRQNANQITPEEASRLQELIPYDPVEKYKKHGKLRLLLNEFPFSEIHVLSDLNEELGKEYQQWIQNDFPNFRIHRVPLENVSDYAEVYRVTKDAISAFKSDDSNQEKDLAYYVNPGTTAMGTTWTLLSKSAFPATLYQLSGSSAKPEIVDLPFDINLDFLPEIEARRNAGLSVGGDPIDIEGLIGTSKACTDLRSNIGRYGKTPFPVLLVGPNGSGKEVAARGLHDRSEREGKFKALNCASIPEDLMESQLFGHFKEAFTSANKDSLGAFHLAENGTLFLDEIGECSLDIQGKLLRVLQPDDPSKPTALDVQPLGSEKADSLTQLKKQVDVRLVFATNRDLAEMVRKGTFRMDLYYRIATLCIRVPSLNERVDDMPVLSEHLLDRQNQAMAESDLPAKTLTVRAIHALCEQEWEGNIRQLDAVLCRAFINTGLNPEIDEDAIVYSIEQDPLANPISESVFGKHLPLDEGELKSLKDRKAAEVSYHYWKKALEKVGGNTEPFIIKAGRELGETRKISSLRGEIAEACKNVGKDLLINTNQ